MSMFYDTGLQIKRKRYDRKQEELFQNIYFNINSHYRLIKILSHKENSDYQPLEKL
jgi:hypothetical protein